MAAPDVESPLLTILRIYGRPKFRRKRPLNAEFKDISAGGIADYPARTVFGKPVPSSALERPAEAQRGGGEEYYFLR
jgi:hypothetical protein